MDEEPSTRLFPGGGTFLISTLIPSNFRTGRTAPSFVLLEIKKWTKRLDAIRGVDLLRKAFIFRIVEI